VGHSLQGRVKNRYGGSVIAAACGQPIVNGLVCGRPEIGEHVRRRRRIHHALGHQDADHVLGRIGMAGGSVAAAPAEAPWGPPKAVMM